MHRQMEREIFEEVKTAEQKIRAGDPAASIEIVSKSKSKAAPKKEVAAESLRSLVTRLANSSSLWPMTRRR